MIRRNSKLRALAPLLALGIAGLTTAADRKSDWIEGVEKGDGATRDYYNRAARLEWRHFMGDWRDANGVAQGSAAYAVARVVDTDSGRFIEWDVTRLVREWQGGKFPNKGFFLRISSGRGKIDFCSRDHSNEQQRPELVVSTGGAARTLRAVSDTHLIKSTYQNHNQKKLLHISNKNHTLFHFNTTTLKKKP